MREDIKKGISYTAIGFLFVLVNLNFNFGSVRVNVMPNFIGWIMLTMAVKKLDQYTKDKKYLLYIGFFLSAAEILNWVLPLAKQDSLGWIVSTVCYAVSVVFFYSYIGVLQNVAKDAGSKYANQLGIIRILVLAACIAGVFLSIFAGYLRIDSVYTVALAMVWFILDMVAALWACFIFFRMESEFSKM